MYALDRAFLSSMLLQKALKSISKAAVEAERGQDTHCISRSACCTATSLTTLADLDQRMILLGQVRHRYEGADRGPSRAL